VQVTVYPDATLHSGIFIFEFQWLEPDDKRGNQLSFVGGKDWHRDHFIDMAGRLDIPDLLCIGQILERKLSFCRCVEFSYI
jgi:hypothetical protein